MSENNSKLETAVGWILGALIVIVLILLMLLPAHGQEVIMNQPSADVVDKGHLFVRSDSFYTQKPAYFFENVAFAYGLGHNLEVSVNGSDLAHGSDVWQIVPGIKWAPIKTKNFEIYVGDQLWKPVSNFTYYHTGNVSYEAAAYKYGNFRFTGGTYQSYNAYAPGNRAGAIGGVEWMAKMFKNGWMVAPGIDYASGAGTNGYTSPGLMFQKKNFFICPGYMIANPGNPNGAHQSFIMIGDTF